MAVPVRSGEAVSFRTLKRKDGANNKMMNESGTVAGMKLLFVHQTLGEFGGAEVNIRLTARTLKARGHTPALLFAQTSGRNEAHWSEIFTPRYCLGQPGNVGLVHAALRDWKPDLIYLHNLADLPVLQTLLDSGLPVVRMVHDHSLYCLRTYKYNFFTRRTCTRAASAFCVFPCLATLQRNRSGWFPVRWASYLNKRRELRLNRECDGFVVYSDYQKSELVANGFPAEKIQVCVPMQIAGNDGETSTFGERNLILFAGQLIRGKGVDALLRALAKLQIPFTCIVLGEGSHRPYCEALCRRLGLAQRVHFQGYLLPAELKQFYLQASVFAMSSLWPEPFGMAGPEAMRYGLPVVAFDAGAIPEWLEDGYNGYLVPWNDTALFAQRLEHLLRHKDLARQVGQHARQSVQRYEAARQIDSLERLFARLTAPSSAVSFLPSEPMLSAYD